MWGARAVTSISDSWTCRAIRSRSGSMPTAQCSRKESQASASRRIDRSTLWMMSGLKTLSSKFPEAPPMVTATSLPTTWAQTMVIASHCVGLTQPGPGARREPAHVVGDLGQGGGECLESAARGDERLVSGESLKLVRRALERQACEHRQACRHALPEAGRRVEPRAHGRTADGELVESGQRGEDGGEAPVEHGHPARNLLTQGQRCRILEMRAADLDDIDVRTGFFVQHVAQLLHGREKPTVDLADRSQMHGGRERVVRRL